jgi:hypothetical protein
MLEKCLAGQEWNAGGQRTWVAPELGPGGFFGSAEQGWTVPPELDPGSYRLLGADGITACCRTTCRLRSRDAAEYRLEIERRVQIHDPSGNRPGAVRLCLRHSLCNRGERPIPARIGLWGIVQIPSLPEGLLLLPDLPYRVYFGELPADWVRRETGRLCAKTAPGQLFKIGQRPMQPNAAVAHVRPAAGGAVQVTLRFPVTPAGPYLDRPPAEPGNPGDALQAYNSPLAGPAAFCELECHAPAPRLQPGEQSSAELEIDISKA